ncbi:hypothetical protein GGR53DRAFT_2937 [Hypoxylon sp. FL1150]|nr:hypothetical protein GGR53DRAFT_2937 [Hypoxylon sp. FL1150]
MDTSTGWIVSSLLLSAFLILFLPSCQADTSTFSLNRSLSDIVTDTDIDIDIDPTFVATTTHQYQVGKSSFITASTLMKAAESPPFCQTRTVRISSTLTTSEEVPGCCPSPDPRLLYYTKLEDLLQQLATITPFLLS